MEKVAQQFYKLRHASVICLRFFNVYGPRQSPDSPYSGVVSKFLQKSQENQPITIFGDGKNTRDFVYVKDVARAIIAAIKYAAGFKVYNVGSETQISIEELAGLVVKAAGSTSSLDYQEERKGDIKHSVSSTRLIYEQLWWSPTVDIADGLQLTLEWYVSAQQKGTAT